MRKHAIFFVWFLPIIWATCSLLHFRHPGDEYAMYAVSSIAGVWIGFIVPFGDIHDPMIPISVAAVGGLVMAAIGFVMDYLRVRQLVWALLFVILVPAVFVESILSYPSIERALGKNGSWWTYVFFSIGMGINLSIPLALLVKGVESGWRKWIRGEGKTRPVYPEE
ncbi:hypothetical protein HQ520_17610 [bacterium]|nr:hypothetical protein [bacterium]